MSNITINNGAATPAAVIYKDRFNNGERHVWSGPESTYALQSTFVQTLKQPSPTAKVVRPTVQHRLPIASTDPLKVGIPAYTLGANVEFLLPVQATSAEIKDLKARLCNWILHANFEELIISKVNS